jgi:hypothetical protein
VIFSKKVTLSKPIICFPLRGTLSTIEVDPNKYFFITRAMKKKKAQISQRQLFESARGFVQQLAYFD